VLDVEVSNEAGAPVDVEGAVELTRQVLAAEGVADGEVGLLFVSSERIAELKREHLGVDEPTDVREAWREPLVHGLLHLLGYDHGAEMQARERVHAS